jgi:hypothetical protein
LWISDFGLRISVGRQADYPPLHRSLPQKNTTPRPASPFDNPQSEIRNPKSTVASFRYIIARIAARMQFNGD